MKRVLAWFQALTNNTIGKSIINVAEAAAESKLDAILQDLHDSNLDDYKAAIAGGSAFIKHLQPLAAKTATTLDDEILADLQSIIATSAAKNNVTL